MPSKSVFKQPGAQHFQLVHRSQRDPLIHDPTASQHVLKEVVRGNNRKGQTRADLEATLDSETIAHDISANVGEAVVYGIYFDDTEYDYMQHLRAVGAKEVGVESVLIEAPSSSQKRVKTKGKAKDEGTVPMPDLPQDVLPSKDEMPQNFEAQQAVPESIAGFRPDMDPHLRQVLEALENEAFVDDSLGDGFFTNLISGGERGEGEVDFEFHEDEALDKTVERGQEVEEDVDSWEARFARFKKRPQVPQSQSDEGAGSEGGDTVGTLPMLSVIGGKRRRKGSSIASGHSMSSSSMYRTEALLTLDERFDQLMLKEYGSDEPEKVEATASSDPSDSDEAPELITTREDFAAMVDDFMENYEVVGRKLKHTLPGATGVDKLDTLRQAMRLEAPTRIAVAEEDEDDDQIFASYRPNEKADRWDCENTLKTHSNLKNHPEIIRAQAPKPLPKTTLQSPTVFPCVNAIDQEGVTLGDDVPPHVLKGTTIRPRHEPKDEKKARKQAVKAERQTKRAEKKVVKEQFHAEIKRQSQALSHKAKSKVRKL